MIGLLERGQILDVLEKEKGRERSRKLPIQHGNTKEVSVSEERCDS